MNDERLIGSILNWNIRGFGFIESQGKSYFFHAKNVRDRVVPRCSDLFLFTVRPSVMKPGQEEAFDLQLARRANSSPAIGEAKL